MDHDQCSYDHRSREGFLEREEPASPSAPVRLLLNVRQLQAGEDRSATSSKPWRTRIQYVAPR